MLTLSKHNGIRFLSLTLGLLYSLYIIYWHEVYVEMAVHQLERIGLDAFNSKVMKVVLGICCLLCLVVAWRIHRQYKSNRRAPITLHGLIAFTLPYEIDIQILVPFKIINCIYFCYLYQVPVLEIILLIPVFS